MNQTITLHCPPDLSARPFNLTTVRVMALLPKTLFEAWTQHLDVWFASPGSVLMKAEVNSVFFFETFNSFEADTKEERHPHYGRFLRLKQDRLIEVTWVTDAGGIKGAETVLTLELTPRNYSTLLKLTHAGFPDEESRNIHEKAWPIMLDYLERTMKNFKSAD